MWTLTGVPEATQLRRIQTPSLSGRIPWDMLLCGLTAGAKGSIFQDLFDGLGTAAVCELVRHTHCAG